MMWVFYRFEKFATKKHQSRKEFGRNIVPFYTVAVRVILRNAPRVQIQEVR
jgi:hypothetical protein